MHQNNYFAVDRTSNTNVERSIDCTFVSWPFHSCTLMTFSIADALSANGIRLQGANQWLEQGAHPLKIPLISRRRDRNAKK